MGYHVLVAMDDSEPAERALEHALAVHSAADVTVLHVVGEPSGMMGQATSLALSEDMDEAVRERAHEVLDRAKEMAADSNAEISTTVEVGKPSKAIVKTAEDFDLVVLGRHSSGGITDRLFVGNVAESVVKESPVPAVVVP